jgi:hypothetical protein
MIGLLSEIDVYATYIIILKFPVSFKHFPAAFTSIPAGKRSYTPESQPKNPRCLYIYAVSEPKIVDAFF